MNHPTQQLVPVGVQDDGDDDANLTSYLDLLFDNRGLIAGIALAITLLGLAYAFIAKPIYEANILIQVEDNPNSSNNILGGLSSMFDTKTAAASEMELLRSRTMVSSAVDSLRLTISARPKYFPVIGAWLAGRNKQLSEPGLAGYGGYAWGAEKIDVPRFNVSGELLNLDFILTAESHGQFRLSQKSQDIELTGRVGSTLNAATEHGTIELRVESLAAKPGAQFLVRGTSRLATIENLQNALAISERGKQSGIIGVTLEGSDPVLTSNILNQIGREYVRQNVERKSAEAEKSLVFLDKQLPELKRHLEQSEETYNRFRNSHGTIDLGEEAKALLLQSVNAQSKLIELQQKREELLIRFTSDHPAVVGVDNQMRELNRVSKSIAAQIKILPGLEQDVLRLARDVKVNTDLYTELLNSTQQLRLVKASKVGNARMIDAAQIPEQPIGPGAY
jgi:tyrosine-protein kinase Etk/Wzc